MIGGEEVSYLDILAINAEFLLRRAFVSSLGQALYT